MFEGLAAGQISTPSDAGTARESEVVQDSDSASGREVAPAVAPAVAHAAQGPEQAAVERPAAAPKVPAGHSEQAAAPARE